MMEAFSEREALALGMLEPESRLIEAARKVSAATGNPVLGGVAVFLHGYERTTADVDVFSADPQATKAALEAIAARWDESKREFVLDGVPIHIVTLAQVGSAPKRTVEIAGVTVVSLADLIAIKLRLGLSTLSRAKDLADVVELCRRLRLDKPFAAELPKDLRTDFKRIIDALKNEA